MATRKTSSLRVRRDSRDLTTVLASAFLEWWLIFLLFVNALFSYLLTRFARFFKLQTPCLLCSRLDHVLGDEKPGFCWDLFCGAHKSEISSLVFCHVHDKLADVHGMCESCLFSFATENKSNSETYRLLVGKLGSDPGSSVGHDLLVKDDMDDSSSQKQCSCCKKSCILRLNTCTLFQTKSIEPDIAEPEIALPASLEKSTLSFHNDLKKSKERKFVPSSSVEHKISDSLSHIGYTELKITSDSESEVHFSDDDDGRFLVHARVGLKDEFITQGQSLKCRTTHPEISGKTLSDDSASVEMIRQTSVSQPFPVVQELQLDVKECSDPTSAAMVGHGLENLDWHKLEDKAKSSALSELISLHDIPSSSHVEDTLAKSLEQTLDFVGTSDTGVASMAKKDEIREPQSGLNPIIGFVKRDLVATPAPVTIERREVCEAQSGLNTMTGFEKTDPVTSPAPLTIEKREIYESKSGLNPVTSFLKTDPVTTPAPLTIERREICESQSGLNTMTGFEKTEPVSSPAPLMTNLMDLTDAYKMIIIGNKGSQVSNMLAGRFNSRDSARASEDLKLLLSQLSAARGLELPSNEMSPRVYGNSEDSKNIDASSPVGLQKLQNRISIERNESGFESLDGSIVSEIEGESVVDRLKRQVEFDRKSMSVLYRELEEERNASAVAANQAMAMITRLQEEKATLQMEALQYLRMMEEQAEYDVDALQKCNELLAEKEKEVQDLQAELEYHREGSLHKPMLETTQEPAFSEKLQEARVEESDVVSIGDNVSYTPCKSSYGNSESSNKPERATMIDRSKTTNMNKDSLVEFEDERLYISQCLQKLEKKLRLFSNYGVHVPNGEYSEVESNGVNHLEQLHWEEASQGSSKMDASILSPETNLVSLTNEVSDLNERLKVLEADRNFLEHTINSLGTGDGVQFIQEIAHQLQELRRIGIKREHFCL